jgi:uroporphyrinogen decarboxylase
MKIFTRNKNQIPIAPLMGSTGIQLTSTRVSENLENADIQFKSLYKLYQKFHPDLMFPMMDLSIEAEALGLKTLKARDSSYTIIEHPIRDLSSLKKLELPEPQKSARMPLMLIVINQMSSNFDCINVAYVTGPYTLAGLLNGASEVIKNVIKSPDLLITIIEYSTKVIDIYGSALIDAGADMICILEPTATGLSPQQYEKFSGRYIKKLRKRWDIPVVLHICGDASLLVPEMVQTGCKGLSLDSLVDLPEISQIVPDDVLLLGNIDPVVVAYGEKSDVKLAVKSLIDKMKGRVNFILSTGCDLPPDTDLENIKYIFEFARKR